MKYQILEYASGEELLQDDYPDILLLDIEMKRINGILVKEIVGDYNNVVGFPLSAFMRLGCQKNLFRL